MYVLRVNGSVGMGMRDVKLLVELHELRRLRLGWAWRLHNASNSAKVMLSPQYDT